MIKARTYSAKGRKLADTVLPKIFEEKGNLKLLSQAIHVYRAKEHQGLSKVRTRGEISLTTRKWYRQKGTGRARHGPRSAPIFVGGGVAHGPKGVRRRLTLSQKMKKRALNIALSLKARAKEIVVISGLSNLKKTKETQTLIDKIKDKELKKLTFVLSDKNLSITRVIRNIRNTQVIAFKDLNAYQVFFAGMIILDKEVLSEKREARSEKK